MPGDHKEEIKKWDYSQLSISRVQFCSSSGYLLRSIMHAAVVVILETYVRGYVQFTAWRWHSLSCLV